MKPLTLPAGSLAPTMLEPRNLCLYGMPGLAYIYPVKTLGKSLKTPPESPDAISRLRPPTPSRYSASMNASVFEGASGGSNGASACGGQTLSSPYFHENCGGQSLGQDHPLVPLYTDALACSCCGGDGHLAHECPTLRKIVALALHIEAEDLTEKAFAA